MHWSWVCQPRLSISIDIYNFFYKNFLNDLHRYFDRYKPFYFYLFNNFLLNDLFDLPLHYLLHLDSLDSLNWYFNRDNFLYWYISVNYLLSFYEDWFLDLFLDDLFDRDFDGDLSYDFDYLLFLDYDFFDNFLRNLYLSHHLLNDFDVIRN